MEAYLPRLGDRFTENLQNQKLGHLFQIEGARYLVFSFLTPPAPLNYDNFNKRSNEQVALTSDCTLIWSMENMYMTT